MAKRSLKINDKSSILVIGSLNSDFSKLDIVSNLSEKYDYVVLNGNLFKSSFTDTVFPKNVLYCLGDLDILYIRNNPKYLKILTNIPNEVELNIGGTKYVVCSGRPLNSKNPFASSFYDSDVDWHNIYSGEYGYVLSNHPIDNDEPKFYNYSCKLGSTSGVYAQEITKFGLQKTFLI